MERLKTKNLHDAFVYSVNAFNIDTAIKYANGQLSFKELDCASNQLSDLINKHSGKPVFTFLPLGAAYHISIVACMKMGCHLYPLDYSDNEASIKTKIEHVNGSACIVNGPISNNLKQLFRYFNIDIIYMPELNLNYSEFAAVRCPDSWHLHSIFTSGSSGVTKLVSFDRETVMYNAFLQSQEYCLSNRDSLFLISKPSSSLHINSFWRSILSGMTLVPADLIGESLDRTWSFLLKSNTTVLHAQVSVLYKLIKVNMDQPDDDKIRHLILGGELLTVQQLKVITEKFSNLQLITYNYSSTETALISSLSLPPEKFLKFDKIPVGTPAEGKVVTIEDSLGRSLPNGEIGQIVVASRYIAKSIHGALKESDYSVDNTSEVKSYKTGDLGFINQDGYLFHLGRVDRQIKINGLRIDPLLIENEVAKFKGIEAVTVFSLNIEETETTILVAAIVKSRQLSIEHVKESLSKNIPFSHIPKFWIVLEELPLTIRGKIDYIELQGIAQSQLEESSKNDLIEEISKTQVSEFIIEQWKRILRDENLSMTNSLFNQGAESLNIFEMVSIINDKWGLQLTPNFVLINPSIIAQITEVTKLIDSVSGPKEEKTFDNFKNLLGF